MCTLLVLFVISDKITYGEYSHSECTEVTCILLNVNKKLLSDSIVWYMECVYISKCLTGPQLVFL